MKNLFAFLFCAITSIAIGQVTCTEYLLKYNVETDQYDVNLVIIQGSASTISHRAQFNSQISIVVPTEQSVSLTDMNMPLENNQSYTSIIPTDWRLWDQVNAPQSNPTSDFYSVAAILSPPSFYNDLKEGDVIHLFSFTVGGSGEYNEEVRLFNKGIDPSSLDPGMGGGNFSNTFRIGYSKNIHNGGSEESCVISPVDEKLSVDATIYPNPFQSNITIKLPKDVKSVQVISVNGNVHKPILNTLNEKLVIPTTQFLSGVYIVRIETNSGAVTSKRIVKF